MVGEKPQIKGKELDMLSIITLPEDFDIRPSWNQERFRETPLVVTLYKVNGLVYFEPPKVSNEKKLGAFGPADIAAAKTFRLFVPEGVKAGDRLKMVWVEERCACAALL